MGASADRWYPIVCGAVGVALYFAIFGMSPLPKSSKDLFSSTLNIYAISAGFLATSKSVLFSISNSKPIKWLKSGGEYSTVIDYLFHAILWCMAAAVLSAVNIFLIDPEKPKSMDHLYFGIWLTACLIALFASYRIIRLLTKVLRKI